MPENKELKKQAQRSPNYPSVDLGRAVELTRKLYEAARMNPFPVRAVQDRWGYKPGSSAGDQAVAALRAYGLIIVEGSGNDRKARVSDVSKHVLLDGPDKKALLRECALKPQINKEVWEHYAGVLPDDKAIKTYLIFEKKFNENAVKYYVGAFRETISYAGLSTADIFDSGGDDDRGGDDKGLEIPPPPDPRRTAKDMVELKFLLPSGELRIYMPKNMTQADYQVLDIYMKGIKQATGAAAPVENATETKTPGEN